MNLLKTLFVIMLGMGVMSTPALAGLGKGHHVNIISFQKDDEVKGVASYPATFTGSFSQLMAVMEGKADPLLLVHTPHIHSGDIINVQVDVLGEGDAGLEDDGLNCSLSYNVDGPSFTIGGMCTILVATAKGAEKHRVIIPGVKVPSSPNGNHAKWVLIFFDKKTEVAFYANIEE